MPKPRKLSAAAAGGGGSSDSVRVTVMGGEGLWAHRCGGSFAVDSAPADVTVKGIRALARAHFGKLARHRLSTFLFCGRDGAAGADAAPATGPALAKAMARGDREIYLRATYVGAVADPSHALAARFGGAKPQSRMRTYLENKYGSMSFARQYLGAREVKEMLEHRW